MFDYISSLFSQRGSFAPAAKLSYLEKIAFEVKLFLKSLTLFAIQNVEIFPSIDEVEILNRANIFFKYELKYVVQCKKWQI